MTSAQVRDITQQLMSDFESERTRIHRIDRWYRGDHDRPHMPRRSTAEYRELQTRSPSPWLGLVVTNCAQALYVDGYRQARAPDNAAAWQHWQRNGMDSRQSAIHRAALAHGIAYATVLPGDTGPVIRGVSSRHMFAAYDNPAQDEWPEYAVQANIVGYGDRRRWTIRLYDEANCYISEQPLDGGRIEHVDTREHGAGVCPVVRYCNQLDLDGRAVGEVEPFIPLAARIDQDTFDRLVVQRFGAWLVKYATGMAKPDTEENQKVQAMALKISDMLISEDPDTNFGTLAATPLDGFISARDADIRDLAAVTQTPPQYLLGQMVNISADALAAAEASLMRKVDERKSSLGESHEQVLRLAAQVAGDSEGGGDFEAQVRWRDTESRSLSTTVDALGKMAQMLGVPVEALWERIPGASDQDVDRWKALAESRDGLEQLRQALSTAAGEPAGQGTVPEPDIGSLGHPIPGGALPGVNGRAVRA